MIENKDGFIKYTNFNNKILTKQECGSKGFGSGEIKVVILNCNKIFLRPIIEWFEECNHVDLKAYKEVKNRENKKYILITGKNETNKSWKNKIKKILQALIMN